MLNNEMSNEMSNEISNDEMLAEVGKVVALNFSEELYLRFNTAKLEALFDLLGQGSNAVREKLLTFDF